MLLLQVGSLPRPIYQHVLNFPALQINIQVQGSTRGSITQHRRGAAEDENVDFPPRLYLFKPLVDFLQKTDKFLLKTFFHRGSRRRRESASTVPKTCQN